MKIYCGFYKYNTGNGQIRLDFLFWHKDKDVVENAIKVRKIKKYVIKRINMKKKELEKIQDKELTVIDVTDDFISYEEYQCVLERDIFSHLEDIRYSIQNGLKTISYIRESEMKNSIYKLMAFYLGITTLTIYDEGYDEDDMEDSLYDEDIQRDIINYRKLLGYNHDRFDTTLTAIRYLTLVKELR